MAIENIEAVCPTNDRPTGLPDLASYTRIVLSSDPDMISFPSGENATHLTASECPFSVKSSLPTDSQENLGSEKTAY